MGLFTNKKVSRLEDQNEYLVRENEVKNEKIKNLEASLRTIETNHTAESHVQAAGHKIDIAKLQAELQVLNNGFHNKVSREIDHKSLILEKAHELKMSQMKKEHLEKMSNLDNKFENDKASYRKYLRTEHNKEIDGLRAATDFLKTRVIELEAIGEANLEIAASAEGTVKALTSVVEGLTKALPTISASFTTPTIPANTVTVGSGNKS